MVEPDKDDHLADNQLVKISTGCKCWKFHSNKSLAFPFYHSYIASQQKYIHKPADIKVVFEKCPSEM